MRGDVIERISVIGKENGKQKKAQNVEEATVWGRNTKKGITVTITFKHLDNEEIN